MDIQHMKYFLALAETLNYTTAAQQCYISRQGIRQAVLAVEKEYGLQLVINEHNHLSLTPAGMILRAHAKEVFSAYQQMDSALRHYAASRDTMHIGVSRSLVPFYAPELVHRLERYAAQLPDGTCRIHVLSADEIMEKLQAGALDAGLIIEAGDEDRLPDLPWQRLILRQDTMTLLMSASHELTARDMLSLQDLQDKTIFVMSDPDVCFSPFKQALQEADVSVRFRIVPDYYEVGYQILNSDVLAIDREEAAGPAPSRLDRNMTLENGRFTLHCSLLISGEHAVKLASLTQFMTQTS